ncbi:MAG: hypothetical protein CPDRYMAC_5951 [uncultured Paraburkholderia sp.]|nr:MAG: hypothetical protein CPDRYMAC_5951 [uncultured Paraburkholderia sp.]
MIAFYLTLAALGAAGTVVIREMAAREAKQRAALRPVRVRAEVRGNRPSRER